MPKRITKPFFSQRPPVERNFKKVESAHASQVIGEVLPGCEIFGLTKGQISIIDIIKYLIEVTGPADVVISTWTAAQKSIDATNWLLKSGDIKSLKFLIDPSFKNRKPQFCDSLVDVFGPDCIRTMRNHAKFITIGNDKWNLVVRTSMNLNQNPRMEYVEISDDINMYGFFQELVAEIFEKIPADKHFDRTGITNESILDFDSPEITQGFDTFDLESGLGDLFKI